MHISNHEMIHNWSTLIWFKYFKIRTMLGFTVKIKHFCRATWKIRTARFQNENVDNIQIYKKNSQDVYGYICPKEIFVMAYLTLQNSKKAIEMVWHFLRMEDSRWPKIYQWTLNGRRRGRPQQSWRNQVTDFMKSRKMEEDMAE